MGVGDPCGRTASSRFEKRLDLLGRNGQIPIREPAHALAQPRLKLNPLGRKRARLLQALEERRQRHIQRTAQVDLASVAMGPLTADLAALETWLAFECPPDERTDDYKNAHWRAVIDQLYAPETFRHAPPPSDPTSRFCWLWSVVRQIRMLGIAVQTCPTEYQPAVAVHLLRRCQWEDDCGADRFRRSHGYLVAAKLTADLQAQAQTQVAA